MNDDTTPLDDNEMRTALALLELKDLAAQQQELIDALAKHVRSHHDALLTTIEDLDHALYRIETLEATVANDE